MFRAWHGPLELLRRAMNTICVLRPRFGPCWSCADLMQGLEMADDHNIDLAEYRHRWRLILHAVGWPKERIAAWIEDMSQHDWWTILHAYQDEWVLEALIPTDLRGELDHKQLMELPRQLLDVIDSCSDELRHDVPSPKLRQSIEQILSRFRRDDKVDRQGNGDAERR